MRSRLACLPAGERFQQREHSGAVLVERTRRPQSGAWQQRLWIRQARQPEPVAGRTGGAGFAHGRVTV